MGGHDKQSLVRKPTTFNVTTVEELNNALDWARHTPGTNIKIGPGDFHQKREWILQGDGTHITGAGSATRLIVEHFNGSGPGGTGRCFHIMPTKGIPQPFDIKSTGIWENPPGTCCKLFLEATGTESNLFVESVPAQYADGKPTAKYAFSTPIIIPAKDIILENLTIVGAPVFMGAIFTHNALRPTIRNITFEGVDGSMGVALVSSQGASVVNVKGFYVMMNSCNDCTIFNNDVDEIALEEACCRNSILKNRTRVIVEQDPLCKDNQFTDNTISNHEANKPSIFAMGTNTVITGNVCDDYICVAGFATGARVDKNTALGFRNFVIRPGVFDVTAANAWREK